MKWRILIVVAIAVIGAGCNDASDPTTTTSTGAPSGEDIVLDSGTMPDSIPEEFPLPSGSSVGSTMVISDGLTEVVIRVSAEQGITSEYYNQALPPAGFDVGRSESTDNGWIIEFTYEGTTGSLDITEPVQGISQVVLRFNE